MGWMSLDYTTLEKRLGLPMSIYVVGGVLMVVGDVIGEPYGAGIIIAIGAFVSGAGSWFLYRQRKHRFAGNKYVGWFWLVVRVIIALAIAALFVFIANDGVIYTKYASLMAARAKSDVDNPPYATPIPRPTDEYSTLEPTATIEAIDLEKMGIRTVLEDFLDSWNNEVFPPNWDEHMTTEYRKRYVGDIFVNVDQLAVFFGDSNRRIGSEIGYENWRNDGTRVSIHLTLLYGDKTPAETCPYWFEMFKDTETGLWFIDGDKSEGTNGPLRICPES